MKPKEPKKGDLVIVVFTDHARGMGAIEFRVAGWVVSKSRKSIEIASWDYIDDRKRSTEDSNLEWFSIVRSAIKSIKIIEHQRE